MRRFYSQLADLINSSSAPGRPHAPFPAFAYSFRDSIAGLHWKRPYDIHAPFFGEHLAGALKLG